MSENNQARGTDAQILKERELTASAIRGAMAFGYQGTNPPPQDPKDHWLSEFWEIGREQRRLELAAQAAPAGVQAEPITDSQAVKSLHAVIRSAGGLVHSDGNIFFTNVDVFQLAALAWQASEATSPPAAQEQADQQDDGPSREELTSALAACRDACPTPPPGGATEPAWIQAIGDPLSVPEFVRASFASPAPTVQASAQPAPVAAQPVACRWTHDQDNGIWNTACGEAHLFEDGGPAENEHRFCPYCGGELVTAAGVLGTSNDQQEKNRG